MNELAVELNNKLRKLGFDTEMCLCDDEEDGDKKAVEISVYLPNRDGVEIFVRSSGMGLVSMLSEDDTIAKESITPEEAIRLTVDYSRKKPMTETNFLQVLETKVICKCGLKLRSRHECLPNLNTSMNVDRYSFFCPQCQVDGGNELSVLDAATSFVIKHGGTVINEPPTIPESELSTYSWEDANPIQVKEN